VLLLLLLLFGGVDLQAWQGIIFFSNCEQACCVLSLIATGLVFCNS